jgi:replicative DNA helicase
MTAKTDNARVLVHTPAEMMTQFVAWAESARDGRGVPFGVPPVDKRMIPMRPGELVTILGRPGDGKSSILSYLARQEAGRILQRKAGGRECVVYVTWEQSAEELTAFLLADAAVSISDIAWGRADLNELRRRAVRGAEQPIWLIGHGIGRAGQQAPRMTPDVVLAAIESMEADFQVRPTLMLFDYLQLIPVPRATERVQQVTEVAIRIKELALRIGVPAVAAVQASREVDSKKVKLAEMGDAQWSSAIEQTSDKVFSLWRPARSEALGATIGGESGTSYTVTDTLFFLRMLKQRGDRGRWTFALYFDPACLRLAELEMTKGGVGYDF